MLNFDYEVGLLESLQNLLFTDAVATPCVNLIEDALQNIKDSLLMKLENLQSKEVIPEEELAE